MNLRRQQSRNFWGARSVACAVVAFFLLFLHPPAFSQTSQIQHTISKLQKENTYLGRDLWFTMCKNADNQAGKYYYLYVASPSNTIVNIHIPGLNDIRTRLTAGVVFTQNIDLSAEVTTSGEVENKAIHVWSDDADLTAYLLSRNPGSSDGMLIIPTTGWGTEYVVASYQALFVGYSPGVDDYPSEFSIVANQNNTVCTITPTADIRASYNPDLVIHKAGVTFSEILQRGQCVQYMSTQAQDADNYDLTSTVITSNKPIGVIGATQCSNIPADYLYCDHICDMLPPVRTWARTYQTVPFAQRTGGDTYLVIGTKPGQVIFRDTNQYCILGNKYSSYFRPDITDASTWSSSDPFLLVQYINSATWEAEHGSNLFPAGDPAMVVINSVEQYVKHIIFQTPSITNIFQNYVNLMVNTQAIGSTTLDGKAISSYPYTSSQPVPFSNYTAFRVGSVQPGTHVINSDSGVGVYIYGFGKEESYAWSGALGLRTFNDPDTVPPITTTSGDCFDAMVSVADNHVTPRASKISEMKLDSIYNMIYTPDPQYQIGIASDSTFYSLLVIDSSKEAFCKIEIHDYAGNRTNVVSTYTPQRATITPPVLNFGSGAIGVTACKSFVISNTGTIPFSWKSIDLVFKNKGFSLGTIGGSSAILPGQSRNLSVCFTPRIPTPAFDTLMLSDGCVAMKAVVIGTGGGQDFFASNEDFGCEIVGSSTHRSDIFISNLSSVAIVIDTITIDDPRFKLATTVSSLSPLFIQPFDQTPVEFVFTPDRVGPIVSHAHFHCPTLGNPPDHLWKVAELRGCGNVSKAMMSKNIDTSSVCGTAIPLTFTVISTGTAPIIIDTLIFQGDTNFKQQFFVYTTPSGMPLQLPITLGPGEEFSVNLNFIPDVNTTGVRTYSVFAISDRGDTTNTVKATLHQIFRRLDPKKDTAIIPTVQYGSPVVSDVLSYCNDNEDVVTITELTQLPGPYSKAFRISNYTVDGIWRTLPVHLASGHCLSIMVQFDPSYSTDTLQSSGFSITSDACSQIPAAFAVASVQLNAPTIQGFTIPAPILSCDTKSADVVLINANVSGSTPLIVLGIAVSGADTGVFIPELPTQATLLGGASLKIPVLFVPKPGVTMRSYLDTVIVSLRDPSGRVISLKAIVSGSACGMAADISSIFAIQSALAGQNTILVLPIDVSITKNELGADPSILGISKIALTYHYDSQILSLRGDKLITAYHPNYGWSLDNSSSINEQTGTLTLVLTNPNTLDRTMTSLGEIHFYPTLAPRGEKSTLVSLDSIAVSTSAGTSPTACLDLTRKGTQFSLIYTCGDSVLAEYLKSSTSPSMIKPITPNPVSKHDGGTLHFEYLTRTEGKISLLLFDELGNIAGRVVTDQYHQAGAYRADYSIRGLATGSYFYRFQVDRKHPISGRIIIQE
ncbi:MAG: hypothetical protein WCH46_05300 [bacterium]